MAPIAVGETIPDGKLAYFDEQDQLQEASVHSLAAGKKVVIFGVPGAFTPTCSMKHVPGFIEKSEELKGKGVSDLLLISVVSLTPFSGFCVTDGKKQHSTNHLTSSMALWPDCRGVRSSGGLSEEVYLFKESR